MSESPQSAKVVTRFAPSPTGYLHVGGARTALFNWLLARHSGGTFYLRIEDTDLARSTDAAVDAVLEDMKWLGLDWDNADDLMFQSKRVDVYNKLFDDLLSRGLAYEAWESKEELDNQRQQAQRAKRPYLYKRPAYTDDQARRVQGRRPHADPAVQDGGEGLPLRRRGARPEAGRGRSRRCRTS